MEAFFHQVVSGLAAGAVYASLALALVMIHRSTSLLNFAQGEMAMFSTYLAWLFIDAGFSYWTAFCATIVGSFACGVAIQRFVMRPLAKAPVLATTIVFIGMLVIFNSAAGWIFSYTIKPFPSPFGALTFGGKFFSGHDAGSLLVTLVILTSLYLFFRFTDLGLAMRGAAENPVSSRLLGIRVDLMFAVGWGLAAAVGAIAGMMIAPVIYLEPNMMSGVLLYAFAAALVGGIDNPGGAVVGGLLIGVLENIVGAYLIGTELKLTVALVVIIGVLLVKPEGLFGVKFVKRV